MLIIVAVVTVNADSPTLDWLDRAAHAWRAGCVFDAARFSCHARANSLDHLARAYHTCTGYSNT